MIIKKKELCINKQNKNITSFKRFDGERRARPSQIFPNFSQTHKILPQKKPVEKFFQTKENLFSSNCDYSF